MRILLFKDAWPFHQSHPKPLWIHQGQLLKSVSFQRDVEKTATTIRRKLHHDFALFDLSGAERGKHDVKIHHPTNLTMGHDSPPSLHLQCAPFRDGTMWN